MDWSKMQLATTQDYGHSSYMTYWCTGALNYQGWHTVLDMFRLHFLILFLSWSQWRITCFRTWVKRIIARWRRCCATIAPNTTSNIFIVLRSIMRSPRTLACSITSLSTRRKPIKNQLVFFIIESIQFLLLLYFCLFFGFDFPKKIVKLFCVCSNFRSN